MPSSGRFARRAGSVDRYRGVRRFPAVGCRLPTKENVSTALWSLSLKRSATAVSRSRKWCSACAHCFPNRTLTGGGAAAAASGPGDSVDAIVGSTADDSSRQKRGHTPDVADGAASEGGVSFELSYGNLELAWLGSDLIETGGTVTLQVLSTDHFAEHARAEVVRVWVILSDGVNCAKSSRRHSRTQGARSWTTARWCLSRERTSPASVRPRQTTPSSSDSRSSRTRSRWRGSRTRCFKDGVRPAFIDAEYKPPVLADHDDGEGAGAGAFRLLFGRHFEGISEEQGSFKPAATATTAGRT